MTNTRITAGCLLLGWFFVSGLTTAFGHSAAHPYAKVVASNVFRLKAPDQPVLAPPPQPLASIRLTGITTVLPRKVACLNVRLPAEGVVPAREVSLCLGEGQSENHIEVLAIDEKARHVELVSFGTRMTVGFDKEPPALAGVSASRPKSQ